MYTVTSNNQITIVCETVHEIFVGWLIRDHGFKLVEAEKEYQLIAELPDEKAYIKAKRYGSTKCLTRRERYSIYGSYQNAIKHAMTALEMKGLA